MCTQDLGTGTRTVVAIVAAETLGLPIEAIKLNIGDNKLPRSGASGGSTTVGGVSSSTRRAAVNAREQLFAKVAPALGVSPEELEATGGVIRVKSDPSKSVTWKQAAGKLGETPISVMGQNPGPEGGADLISSGVGGAQMADVSVDTETGVIKVNKIVAVQDCGLIIDMKTAESQCYGALIMGIGYTLFEERVMDEQTGRMLNPNMEFYKLAGFADIPELVVHMWTDADQQKRGVIGLGEPPTVSPGACIANAVTNAIGARVPTLPLTPDKVLAALEKGGLA
jgi:xanthine dehydrogenase YagR molybdenum-binding subunit